MNRKIWLIGGAVLVFGLAAVCILGVGMGGLAWFWFKSPLVEQGPAVVDDSIPVLTPALTEPPAVDFAPRPALAADIRQPDALAGEPVLVSVRLRNAGALAAAHANDGGTSPQPLLLNGNWRDAVEVTVTRVAADGLSAPVAVAVAAVLLSPGPPEPETEVGVRALAAVWALPPDSTAQWESGDYRVFVKLNAAGLLSEGVADVETKADFSLTAPGGLADMARLEQTIAFYDLKQNNCEAALEHALKAIELDPAGYPAYWYAAECYAASGQTTEAVTMLEKLLAVMPPGLSGSDYHAAVEIRLAQLQEAE